jgi:superfamily I DNA/RNA helicase
LNGIKTINLRFHYRNGREICRLADALVKNPDPSLEMLPRSNYDEKKWPSTVEHLRCKDLEEEVEKLTAKLELQVKAYPDELIAVMCPKNDLLEQIYYELSTTSLAPRIILHKENEHSAFETGMNICLCTFHAAKGLEFRTVHLVGCELLKRFRFSRNLTFTAVTRAKTSLSIYYKEDISPFLESALVALEPEADLPPLNEAFGRKGRE